MSKIQFSLILCLLSTAAMAQRETGRFSAPAGESASYSGAKTFGGGNLIVNGPAFLDGGVQINGLAVIDGGLVAAVVAAGRVGLGILPTGAISGTEAKVTVRGEGAGTNAALIVEGSGGADGLVVLDNGTTSVGGFVVATKLSAAVTIDFALIGGAGGPVCGNSAIQSLTGVTSTMTCVVSPDDDATAVVGSSFSCFPESPSRYIIRHCCQNGSTGSCDPPSGSFNVRLLP